MVCGSQKSSRSRNAIGRSIAATATSPRPAPRNKAASGSGSQEWKCGRGSRARGFGVRRRDRLPEVPHALHLAAVVPDVGTDHAAGAGGARHLGDRESRIGHEVEDEPGDHRVVVVVRHREGTGVADREAGTRIGNIRLSGGKECGRGIDPHYRARVGHFEHGGGEGAGAAADVQPAARRGSREPGEEHLGERAAPSPT